MIVKLKFQLHCFQKKRRTQDINGTWIFWIFQNDLIPSYSVQYPAKLSVWLKNMLKSVSEYTHFEEVKGDGSFIQKGNITSPLDLGLRKPCSRQLCHFEIKKVEKHVT